MKKYIIPIVLIIIIITLIVIPLFKSLVTIQTDTEKFLLDIFITCFSLFLGFKLEDIRNEKRLSEKWMPAAQNAALKLVTLSSHAKNLITSHKRTKAKLDSILPDNDEIKNLKILKSIIDMKCETCADSMISLKDNLDTSLKEWETFIDYNCEKPLCSRIHSLIERRKNELGLIEDFDVSMERNKCNE